MKIELGAYPLKKKQDDVMLVSGKVFVQQNVYFSWLGYTNTYYVGVMCMIHTLNKKYMYVLRKDGLHIFRVSRVRDV